MVIVLGRHLIILEIVLDRFDPIIQSEHGLHREAVNGFNNRGRQCSRGVSQRVNTGIFHIQIID